MKCSNCGNEIAPGRLSCPSCGAMTLQSSYVQEPVNGQSMNGENGTSIEKEKDKLSLIFGIISIVSLLLVITIPATPIFAILAIVFKRRKKAGKVIGIVTLSIFGILLAVYIGSCIYYAGYGGGFDSGYDSGYDSGFDSGYDNGYDVPWYEKW